MAQKQQEEVVVWSQQFLLPDASVYSRQWLQMPAELFGSMTPRALLTSYLAHIRRSTFAIIRPNVTEGAIHFRLFDTHISLLSFSPPEIQEDSQGSSVTLCLSGGILVQPTECGRGRFSLGVEQNAAGVALTVHLTDYCPLLLGSNKPSWLRKLLYRLTQAYIHKIVTVRFLANQYRKLTGREVVLKVIKLKTDNGEEI